MAFVDDFVEALQELEDVIPATVSWNSTDYPCFSSGFRKVGKLEDGGFSIDWTGTILVRVALFGDGPFPDRGQTVTFRDVTYRIDSVLKAQGGSYFRLFCIDPTRGA